MWHPGPVASSTKQGGESLGPVSDLWLGPLPSWSGDPRGCCEERDDSFVLSLSMSSDGADVRAGEGRAAGPPCGGEGSGSLLGTGRELGKLHGALSDQLGGLVGQPGLPAGPAVPRGSLGAGVAGRALLRWH